MTTTFVPHPLLTNGHAQTLGGFLLPGKRYPYRAHHVEALLPDGDRIILHDDRPDAWTDGGPVALMIHGLAGCHRSPYMERISGKLVDRGVRVFRMDLRGCGAGAGLARLPYHSGRSEDAKAALEAIERICPGSPVTLIGFSLGGNIVLKLAGEFPEDNPANLSRVIAVSPPIDLKACVSGLARAPNQLYDRHFVGLLLRQLDERRRTVPDAALVDFIRRPRKLLEFDNLFTAPVAGFGTADNYYLRCSSAQFLSRIQIPTHILTSRDDPMVPSAPFESAALSPSVTLHMTGHGGHLGFISKGGTDPDRRWMDWRVLEWATESASKVNDPTRALHAQA